MPVSNTDPGPAPSAWNATDGHVADVAGVAGVAGNGQASKPSLTDGAHTTRPKRRNRRNDRLAEYRQRARRQFWLTLVLSTVVGIGFLAWKLAPGYLTVWQYQPQVGDVLFQSLPSSALSHAIEGATDSPFSHCGIVDRIDGQWVVVEALGSVRLTPLERFIRRGRGGGLAVKRVNAEAYPHVSSKLPDIIAAAHTMLGRPYDSRYRFDREAIYCSELIWYAILDTTGDRAGMVVQLGD